MCGRFALTLPPEAVRQYFAFSERPNFPPRFNIAPTQPIAIVREGEGARHFALARWGLIPFWVKDLSKFPLLINARAEGIATKPAFRAAMRQRRCLVPADGFYEWQKVRGGPKRPHLIRPAGGGPMAFAGLWESWRDAEGGEVETAAIITVPANGLLKPVHDRMPAILSPEVYDTWLDSGGTDVAEAVKLLGSAPEDFLAMVEIGTAVNNVANDSPAIQRPVGASD